MGGHNIPSSMIYCVETEGVRRMQVHISLSNYLREYGMYRWLTHRPIRNSKDGTILESFRGWREIQSQFLGSPEKPKRRDG